MNKEQIKNMIITAEQTVRMLTEFKVFGKGEITINEALIDIEAALNRLDGMLNKLETKEV